MAAKRKKANRQRAADVRRVPIVQTPKAPYVITLVDCERVKITGAEQVEILGGGDMIAVKSPGTF